MTVVCGHWSTLGLVMRPNLLALDTGCVWEAGSAPCAAHDPSARDLVQVDCPPYCDPLA